MILTFCTRPVVFIIVTGFSLAVGHPTSFNFQASLNKYWHANKLQLEKKADKLCTENWHSLSSVPVRQKHIAIRISGLLNRDIPVISRTPSPHCLSVYLVNNVSKHMQQTTFSDAFFVGFLRVNRELRSCTLSISWRGEKYMSYLKLRNNNHTVLSFTSG